MIWEISRAIEKRDAKRAINLIDSLLAKNENAVGLIKASIIPTVRNLFFAKLAEPYGSVNSAPDAVKAVLPKKKDGSMQDIEIERDEIILDEKNREKILTKIQVILKNYLETKNQKRT